MNPCAARSNGTSPKRSRSSDWAASARASAQHARFWDLCVVDYPRRQIPDFWTARRNLSLLDRHVIPPLCTRVQLPRTADLLVGINNHFFPLSDPADRAGKSEKRREHARREPQRLQRDARIEIDVRVQLLLDEIIVL